MCERPPDTRTTRLMRETDETCVTTNWRRRGEKTDKQGELCQELFLFFFANRSIRWIFCVRVRKKGESALSPSQQIATFAAPAAPAAPAPPNRLPSLYLVSSLSCEHRPVATPRRVTSRQGAVRRGWVKIF